MPGRGGSSTNRAPEQINDHVLGADGRKKKRQHFPKVRHPAMVHEARRVPSPSPRRGARRLNRPLRLLRAQDVVEQLEAEYKKIDAESPYGTVADELGESLGQDPQRIKCVRSCAPPHQQVADRQVALTHLRNLIRARQEVV